MSASNNLRRATTILNLTEYIDILPEIDGESDQEIGELVREIADITEQIEAKGTAIQNPNKLLRSRQRRRLEQAMLHRIQRKQDAQEASLARRHEHKKVLQSSIAFIGGIHNHLIHVRDNRFSPTTAAEFGLPLIQTPTELANAMNISIKELHFLVYHRTLSTTSHYQTFRIPKKTGGFRTISAPMPRLKSAQYWIQQNILSKIPTLECVHGFVPGRSIVTNATPHIHQDVVINLDIKDFFPSITESQVITIFQKIGYPVNIAVLLARLCTMPIEHRVQLDGQDFILCMNERILPQGAPTSPSLSNHAFAIADQEFMQICASHNLQYTRYADDLTFSGTVDTENIGSFLFAVRSVIKRHNFTEHPSKTRIMRKGRRQEVTGIVVNEKLNLDRIALMKFRAFLHHIDQNGLDGAYWNGTAGLLDKMMGFACFVCMVHPTKGEKLLATAKKIAQNLRM